MSTFARRLLPVWLFGLALLLPSTARAQFDAATVLGNVTDEQGAAVPGATVTLTNLATGIVATTVSEATGAYQFLNVRVGTYSIEAELQGFSKAVAVASPSPSTRGSASTSRMKVGGIGETVEVTGAARLLESESSDRGQVIGREQIVNLPLNGRAYADLALLSPGVRQSSISSSRDASFNVNGMRSSLNNFILDGVDNNSYGTSNQGFSNQVVQVSPDAVEEFKVQTNNFSAEFGRAGGAVINATFRSGTNEFHGTAWEFNRNTSLNATGFFKPSLGRQAEAEPQPVRRRLRRPDRRATARSSSSTTRASGRCRARSPSPACRRWRSGRAIMGKPIAQPADRRGLRRRRHPGSRRSRRSPAACWPACRRRRGPASRTTSTACRSATDDNDKVDVKVDQQFGSRDERLRPLQPPQGEQLRAAADPGRDQQPVERLRRGAQPAAARSASRARCRPARCSKCASACRAPRPARPRSAPAARTCSSAYGITGLPTDDGLRRRPDAAVGERLDGVGPSEQQPAVPGSAGRRLRASTTRRSAAATR